VPLATKTLTATATSVTFSSISQAYRDLVLVCALKSNDNQFVYVQLNGDSANYNQVWMQGNGTAASSSSLLNLGGGFNLPSNLPGAVGINPAVSTINLFDYSATNKHKSGLIRTDNAGQVTVAQSIRWASTAAITSVNFCLTVGYSFAIGSTFTLYGVAA